MSKRFANDSLIRSLSHDLPSEPHNHGRVWSTDMMQVLHSDFMKGYGLRTLCQEHGRTPDSIIAKLRTLNLIRYDPCNSVYYYDTTTDTQPETKLENTMTQPLQNLTLIFGSDIKTMTEAQLITNITRCTAEINSFSVIPRNKWTEKRTAELNAAIDAAVAELDTRA